MQQSEIKRVQEETRNGEEDDRLGIEEETEIWPYCQIVYALSRIYPEEWDA